ncbi:MAG: class C sortase [Oscillospiraceae bacterium]|nr:class C sortase [Oscillospiraceae bacterium]
MKDTKKRSQKKKKSWISTVILLFILLVGAAIIAYPTVSDWWNSFHQSRAIATYASVVEETDTALMEQMLEDARAYNARLLTKENRYKLSDEEVREYESLLNLAGNGVMGYIQINAIGVSLPLYHGTEESVLQVAIGHIEGTSLPVGGASTHCVLSGHRGLPSARLFSDLDKLMEGDLFTITVLTETMTYQVDQIRIVEPEDMSDLNIVSGGDYCTLVTCTPYGINTHRLLVRGHRIENIADEAVVTAGAVRIPTYLVVPAVGIPLLFVFLLGLLIYYTIRKSGKTQDELDRLVEQAKWLEQNAPPDSAQNPNPQPDPQSDQNADESQQNP